jgi:hypothetical protein
LEIILKCLEFFEKAFHHFKKASISLKMSSKSLVIFEKASFLGDFYSVSLKMSSKRSLPLSLKMSLKSLKIVQNTSHYWKKPLFLFKCIKKASQSLKILHQLTKA